MKKKLSIALLLMLVLVTSLTLVACKHKHNYTVASVTEPTCTERGYTTYVCECGDSYKDNYTQNLPHAPKAATNENVVDASCTQNGGYDEVVRCAECNAVISSTHHNVEMTPHTPKDEPTRENEVAPTCTTQGSYNEVVRCKDCNAVISSTPKTIEKLPHTPLAAQTENVVNATCANAGSYDEVVRCKDCNEVLSTVHHDGVTLPHTPKDEPVRENEIPATCTSQGSYNEVVRCKDCNAVISSTPKTIEMLAHSPKSPARENVVNSTCSAVGSYDEVVRCKDCNAVISSTPKTIEKRPHTHANAVTENNVLPTCTTQGGYDQVVYCSVCNEQLSLTHNTVAKLPHNYEYGSCKDCGYKIEDEAQFTANGFDIDYTVSPMTVSCTVSNATSNIDLVRAFSVQSGVWKLYSDFEGNYEYKLKAMSLNCGHNVAYIIVYYDKDSDYFTRYKLDIYRLSIRNYTFADFDGSPIFNGTIDENSAVSAPESNPTRDYYNFDYWTVDGEKVAFPHTVTNDITFTAKYSPITYSITYVVNGGTLTTEENDFDVEHTVTFDVPTKDYYDFVGWYDNAEFGGDIYTGLSVGSHDNKTFYAKWTPTVYGITYETNGGTLTTNVNNYDIERAVTFDTPLKLGYTFEGWFGNAELNGEAYLGLPIGNHGDKTFYAKWSPTVYEITYETNGGTLTTDVNDYDIERTVTFDNPTREYYTFAGWYDNAAFNGNAEAGIPVGNHGDKTFYAKWTPITYEITYETNGGTLTTDVNNYDIERTVTFDNPTRDYYTFAGWYANAEFCGDIYTGLSVGSHDNKTFYAKWTPTVYTITYQLNGGTMQTDSETFTIEDLPYTPTPAIPYKANYIFVGWYKNSGLTVSDLTVTTVGDTFIYAKWTNAANLFTYSLSSDSTYYTVTGYKGSYTDIAIPTTYNNKPVTSIGISAFEGCRSLTSVTIGSSVTSINENAFSGCSSLTKVNYLGTIADWCNISFSDEIANPLCYAHNLYLNNELVTELVIPDTVTEIKDYAFYGCTSITSVTIGNSVTSIGNYTFFGGSSLTSITIPDGVTSIGSHAFSYCSSLTSITIPNSVKSIGDEAFYNCSSLTSVTIPDSVTSISYCAFYNCSSLTSVTIPDTVTSISYCAFYNCSSLTSVTIPDSVTSISYSAFSGCSGLTSVYYTGDIAGWSNIRFSNSAANPLCFAHNLYIDNELVTELVIPNSVTSIGNYTFSGCSSLTSITIPDSVTEIGYSAFSGCSSLTSIYYTGDMVGWSNISFSNSDANPLCYAHNLYIDNELVTELVIPDTVTEIEYQFVGISATSLTIPDSVTSIGNYAFSGCSSLETVYWNTTACASAGSSYNPIFNGCSYLIAIVIGDNVTTIPNYAFYNCSSLTSITIPDSITSIGISAFYGCSGLTSVYYTGDIAGWSNISFSNSAANPLCFAHNLYIDNELVTELVIPNSVTSIGNYTFSGCSSLTSITIPDSVTEIGYSAFSGCSNLTSIYYTGDIVGWSNISFSNSDANPLCYAHNLYIDNELVTELVIPDTVTEIEYQFVGISVTSLIIPDSVTSISEWAFSGCSSLKTVYYKGTADDWARINVNSKGNNYLTDATRYYYSETEPALNADGTAYDGNYWHYNDNHEIVMWTYNKENN